jgi:hypothetical protein
MTLSSMLRVIFMDYTITDMPEWERPVAST